MSPTTAAYLPPGLREQLHSLGRSPADQTPAGTFAKDILQRLLIDLSWASSHLEGNTYSHLDTERLIEFGQAAEGKTLETQMILNHKQAIEYLVLNPENARVHTDTLIALHAFLSDGLMADPPPWAASAAAPWRSGQRLLTHCLAPTARRTLRHRHADGRRDHRPV